MTGGERILRINRVFGANPQHLETRYGVSSLTPSFSVYLSFLQLFYRYPSLSLYLFIGVYRSNSFALFISPPRADETLRAEFSFLYILPALEYFLAAHVHDTRHVTYMSYFFSLRHRLPKARTRETGARTYCKEVSELGACYTYPTGEPADNKRRPGRAAAVVIRDKASFRIV